LLEHAEKWAREKGMKKMVGPMGISDQNPEAEGFQIEGFEHAPTIATYCNFKYIIRLLENEGYTKEVDYVVYKVPIPKEIPEFYKKINQRVLRRKEFTLVEFSRRSQLKPYIRPIFNLLNECFKDSYGFLPIADGEGSDLARRYLIFFDPRFIKIATRKGEVVSLVLSIPNLSDGLRKARGRLFPFGIFKILRAAKKTKQLDLLYGAVKEKYRGRGLDVFMGLRMFEEARDAGLEFMDSHHELETNTRVRNEMEAMKGTIYKRFRIFQKAL
jgi:GNAT superfamily N-acetyltransferase